MAYDPTLIVNAGGTPDTLFSASEKINQNFTDIAEALVNAGGGGGAGSIVRGSFTGGTQNCLDDVEIAGLPDYAAALVLFEGVLYHYELTPDRTDAENVPSIITPDVNPGNKRWVLKGNSLKLGTTAQDACAGNDQRLEDAREALPHEHLVVHITNFPAFGSGAGNICEGNDGRIPTSGQKAALAGSSGTPSALNPYITKEDPQMTDARPPQSHKDSHIKDAVDEVDGDRIDIDWNPANYTPATVAEAGDVDHLAAHLKGIDTAIGAKASSDHDQTHIKGGTDEVDGDRIDIDWNPTGYDPTTVTEAGDVDHLSAHLAGIDSRIIVVSDLAKLANDGRMDLDTATSINWNGSVVGLFSGTRWEPVKPASIPVLANNALDLNGTQISVDKVYDEFLNFVSPTSCLFTMSKWAVSTAGSSSRAAAYNASTNYVIGDRCTYSGRAYYCQQACIGKTPSSEPTYWVDNGTNVTGDYAGLYKHDGVWVSHNTAAGKKMRWIGCNYTHNNSNTVNFKKDSEFLGISNYYNKRPFRLYKGYDPEPNHTLASSLSYRWVSNNQSYTLTRILLAMSTMVSYKFEFLAQNNGGWAYDVQLLFGSIATDSAGINQNIADWFRQNTAAYIQIYPGFYDVALQERVAYSDSSKSGQFAFCHYVLMIDC